MGNNKEKSPIGLFWLLVIGVVSSIAVVGVLFMLFAAYETQTWLFWQSPTRLDQDTLFGVGRNAVTLAAALGVGVTLFFSYRKQQTAERGQDLAVKAQNMAIDSQRLATETLRLSLEKHELERISELRNRYARSAEQLASDKDAIQLAGVHSLASLADDWARIGNRDDQQVCISLLCSFVSGSTPLDSSEGTPKNTACQVIFSRLQSDVIKTPKSWADSTLTFIRAPLATVPSPVFTGGKHTFTHSHWRSTTQSLTVEGGLLRIEGDLSDQTFPRAIAADFRGGRVILFAKSQSPARIRFYRPKFTGTRLIINMDSESEKFAVSFQAAEFISGSIKFQHENKAPIVVFHSCTFTSAHIFVLDGQFSVDNFRLLNCKFADAGGEHPYSSEEFIQNAKASRGARTHTPSLSQARLF